MTKAKLIWHLLFEGTGSVTGNDWLEEVCYLGQEKWLLVVRDDPAWSGPDAQAQDQAKYSSLALANWVVDMDGAGEDNGSARVHALLEVATAEGAKECEAALRAFLAGPVKVEGPASSAMAKGWARLSSIRAEGKRRAEGKKEGGS